MDSTDHAGRLDVVAVRNARTLHTEHQNVELNTEREHEPSSQNGEV
jgi:hypothetical protein